MPMSEELKQQVKDMHFNQGMSAVQIAEQLNLRRPDGKPNHLPCLGLIQQEKVRRGIIPPPSSAPRKVKETKTITYDEAPPASQHASALPFVGATPQPGAPLFAGEAGVCHTVQVERFFARPQSAGTGFMGNVPSDSSQADIAEMWGGGSYVCRPFDAQGNMCGKPKSVKIAGLSKYAEQDEGETWGPHMMGYGAAQPKTDPALATLVQGLMTMMAAGKQTQQLSFDEQLRMERERHQQALALQQQNAQMAMQLQQQANAQMMSIVVAANGNKGGLQETLAVMTAAKDLFGGDGGSSEADAVTEAIKGAPKMLEGLGNLIKARGGQPGAVTQTGNGTITLDQAGMTFYEELIKQGLTQEEAIEELAKVQRHLQGKVKQKQLALAAAQAQAQAQKPKQVQAAPVVPPAPPAQPTQPAQPTPPANGAS